MNRQTVNPTPWMQHFNLNHGVAISGATRTLYLSGQTASAADGAILHPGDMVAQFHSAWASIGAALAEADMTPANIVRLGIYTTDVDQFMAKADQMVTAFAAEDIQIACTLVGVTRLYDPAAMLELEATATA